MNPFFRKLRWLMRRGSREAELRRELQFHLDEEAELRIADGWQDEDAIRAARRELGNVTMVQENKSIFSSLFAYYPSHTRTLTIKGQAEITDGEFVSAAYFRGLEVPPAAGRLILADDDRAGAPPVVVISMRFSERRFSGAANA